MIACGDWSYYQQKKSRRVFKCAELATIQKLLDFNNSDNQMDFLGGDMVIEDQGQFYGLSAPDFIAGWAPV